METGTTTILDDPAERAQPRAGAPPWFDVCHAGVVLRALLFVHAAIAVALLFAAGDLPQWLMELAFASALATPATLAWLLAACALRRFGSAHAEGVQAGVAISLGAACAAGVSWALAALGSGPPGPLLAPPLAGAALAALFVYWLRIRARTELPARTAAQLQELQARIRPHFLFNALNTAIALVRTDPQSAETVLEDLADLFRAALVDDGQPSTLGAEIDVARRYLAIERLRFGDRLQVQWLLDPAAERIRVPPLLLQPLVENAVRHGIEPAEGGGMIRVRTQVQGPLATISVSNTWPGARSAPGHGIGLDSVRRRLLLMHDVQARFAAGPHDDGEYRVDIAVPLD